MQFQVQSIDKVLGGFKAALKRFPFVILFAIATATIHFGLSHDVFGIMATNMRRLGLVFTLGVPLFFGIHFLTKNDWFTNFAKDKNLPLHVLIRVLGFLFLGAFYYLFYDVSKQTFLIKYLLYLLIVHLIVALSSFHKSDDVQRFWQFNKTLLIQFIVSSIYSVVLGIGLTISLATFKFLFKLGSMDKLFLDIWIFTGFIFHVIHFVANIPNDINSPDRTLDYPNGLKIFTQYLLIPLIFLYGIILYLYEFKIILNWELPKGGVSMMVIVMSVLGILNILLLYPKIEDAQDSWIKKYSKFYFIFLLPLIGLLMVAISKRLSDYGITEGRYYVLLLGIWLVGTCLYYLFSKKKEIRLIPLSLLIASFLSSFGPWGASSLSLSYQFSKLETRLSELKMLVNKEEIQVPDGLAQVDFKRAEDLLRYLYKNHGIEPFLDWKNSKGESLLQSSTYPDLIKFMQAENLVVHTYDYYDSDMNIASKQFYYSFKSHHQIKVKSYDFFAVANLYTPNTRLTLFEEYKIDAILTNDGIIKLLVGDEVIKEFSVINFLKEIKEKGSLIKNNEYNIPAPLSLFTLESKQFKFQFFTQSFSGKIFEKETSDLVEYRIDRFNAKVLVQKKSN